MKTFQAGETPKRRPWAEREHDGPDHQEGGGGQDGSTLVAAGAPGSSLPLRLRGKLTIGTHNGITQTQAHLGMFPGLGFDAFPEKAHQSNQT